MALPPGPAGLKFWQPRVEITEADWTVLYAQALDLDHAGNSNDTLRQTVAVAAYDAAAPATGTKLRVTIQGGASEGAAWTKAYIGHAALSGDGYDFDGSQVQLLFSGQPNGSVVAGSVSLVSDPVSYSFDKTRPLVISIYLTTTQDTFRRTSGAVNFSYYYFHSDSAALTNVSADGSVADALTAFSKIEVYSGSVASSGNITLPADGGSYTLAGSETGLGLGYWLTGFDATFVTAPVGGGGTTLAADAGSYALTGSNAGLAVTANLVFPATAGSYNLAGAAAAFALRHVAGSGSYNLTGTAAALALKHAAGSSSYSLTGTAATFKFTHAAGAGAYTLTGSAAGLNATANMVLGATAGAYAITGSSAGFATGDNAVIPTDPGSYALTGTAATFTISSGDTTLVCGSGSYTLTGSAATFVLPVEPPIEPPTGVFVGTPAGASRGRMIRRRERRREDEDLAPPPLGPSPPDLQPPAPGPQPPDLKPPPPGLMADMPMPKPTKLRSPPDEDEDEIALLLELLS